MKKKRILSLCCFFGVIGWYFSSCQPIQSYSEIPEIHFKKLVFIDSIDNPILGNPVKYAILTFSFIDGDGDLGVKPDEKDQNGNYRPGGGLSRIHYTWYQKLADESYEPFRFESSVVSQSSEIPYNRVMDKTEAQNKTLKGTIRAALNTPTKPQGVDIMRVEFYIVDRAGNESNKELTPDFSILDPPYEPITN